MHPRVLMASSLTPNASYSVSVLVRMPNNAAAMMHLVQAIAHVGANLTEIELLNRTNQWLDRQLTIESATEDQAAAVVEAIAVVPDVEVLRSEDCTFALHQGGKISVEPKLPLTSQSQLAMAYTPGVGRVCKAIAAEPDRVYELTVKQNMVAIVTDGTAVLGLGNLGPAGALPVMEGKAMLFKAFGNVDAFPICLDTQDTDEIVETVKRIAPVFGGVNLEDIAAPRCFEIEARLKRELDIPVFHDDQHGTAIVTLAALENALKLVKKSLSAVRIVMNGAGAAGLSVANLLKEAGATDITICDSRGILSRDRADLNSQKQAFAVTQNGTLADALVGADVFIGLSAPGVVSVEMVETMASDRIIFAMANPIPEIQPELIQGRAAVIATGRSDYPNQINNVLAFPGVFRGALDCRAKSLTSGMFLAAARAIAALVPPETLSPEHIVPSAFDSRVAPAVAAAVVAAAQAGGLAQVTASTR